MARWLDVSDLDPAGTALLAGIIMVCVSLILNFVLRPRSEKLRWESLGKSIVASVTEAAEKNRKNFNKRWEESKASYFEIVTNTGIALEESRRRFTREALIRGFHYKFFSVEYVSRLSVVTIFFAIASYLNSLAAVIAGYRTPNVQMLDVKGNSIDAKTLPDLGHDFLEYIEQRTGSLQELLEPDDFILMTGYFTLFFIVAHPKRLLIIRRLFAIFGYVNICRMVCVLTTSLPDSSPRCVSQFSNDNGAYKLKPMFPKVFFRAWHLTIKPSEVVTCGDMIFSGHTVFLILCYKVMSEYCSVKACNTPLMRWLPSYTCAVLRGLSAIITIIGLFAILATRLHYTLDVIIAVYITRHAWALYHRWTHQMAIDHGEVLEGSYGWDTLFKVVRS